MSDLEDKVDRWELQELQNQVYDLESKVERLLEEINQWKNTRPVPVPLYDPINNTDNRCSKCGIDWSGAIGYVCSDSNCPMQFKVTC